MTKEAQKKQEDNINCDYNLMAIKNRLPKFYSKNTQGHFWRGMVPGVLAKLIKERGDDALGMVIYGAITCSNDLADTWQERFGGKDT